MKTVWLITIATSLLQTVHCAPSAPTNSKSTAAADRPQSPARLKEIAQQKEIQAQLDAYDAFNTKMNVIALVVGVRDQPTHYSSSFFFLLFSAFSRVVNTLELTLELNFEWIGYRHRRGQNITRENTELVYQSTRNGTW